jgi:hypothetical protein
MNLAWLVPQRHGKPDAADRQSIDPGTLGHTNEALNTSKWQTPAHSRGPSARQKLAAQIGIFLHGICDRNPAL